MAWQAIFTSLPAGLVDGQSGFCLAARHEEMPEHLPRAIEPLSAYSHFAAPDSDEADTNPIIAAHRILEFQEGRFHVLSRIRSAGLDFARRSNHIAHHLVFTEEEIANLPSPAHILRAWPGWHAHWCEPPRFLGNSDKVDFTTMKSPPNPSAKTWKAATGRGEYALLLLNEQIQQHDGCYVVAALLPGAHQPLRGEELLLRLFEESLLCEENAEKRWSIPFTTFLQSTDNAADFVWRGWRKEIPLPADVQAGSAYAFDLTDPSRLPPLEIPEPAAAEQEERSQPMVVEATPPVVPEEDLSQTPSNEHAQVEASLQPQEQGASSALPPVLTNTPPDDQDACRHPEKATTDLPPIIGARRHIRTDTKRRSSLERQTPPSNTKDRNPPKPGLLLKALCLSVVLIAAATAGIVWLGQTVSEPAPRQVVPSPSSGTRDFTKEATPATPPAMSETEARQPVYLVMDGDDISKILEEHLGANLAMDTLNARCELSAREAYDGFPPLFSSQSKVTMMPDTGNVYGGGNTLLFRLVPGPSSLKIHTAQKPSHWCIRFRPRTEAALSNGDKPHPCTLLLLARKLLPPFKWNADCLSLDKGCLAVGDSTHKKLDLLRLRTGKVRLVTQLAIPGSQPVRSLVMESPALDVFSLNYEELVIDVTPATSQYDKSLAALRTRKAGLERQSGEPENVVKNAQQWLLNEPDFNTACGRLFDCVFIKAQKWNFDDYWRALPPHTKQGKDLPEWGDYCNYLVYICEAYVTQRLGSPLSSVKKTKIHKLLFNSNAKPIAPEDLTGLIDRLEKTFSVYLRSKSSWSKPDSGATSAPRPYSNFKNEWDRIFAQERIRSLQNLIRPHDLGDCAKQIEEVNKEVQRIEELKQRLPKTSNDFGVVWLVWDITENGTTQSIPLVEFGASSATATALNPSAELASTISTAQTKSVALPTAVVQTAPPLGVLRSVIHVTQEGQDIKPLLIRGFSGQIAQNNLSQFYEMRVQALTNGCSIQTPASSPAVYMPENGAVYEQDRPVFSIERGPGIIPRVKERSTHWFISFSPLNDNLLATEFLLLVSRQPPLPPPVLLTTDDLEFLGRRVSLGSKAVAQLKPLQPVSGFLRFVTTVHGEQWWSPEGEAVVKSPGTNVNYAMLGLNFGQLDRQYDTACAKNERSKAELETRFAGVRKAQDMILHDTDYSEVGDKLLRIVDRESEAISFAVYWVNSPRRKLSGRAVPGWTDYASYLADVWAKYLNALSKERIKPSDRAEIERMLSAPPNNRPGLVDAPALIHKRFASKLQDIPVLTPSLVTIPRSSRKSNSEESPSRPQNKDRMEAFKEQWVKVFNPTTVTSLVPLTLVDSHPNYSQALVACDNEIKRLRDLKNRLPITTNQLESFQLLWFPDTQPTSFTLAEFRKN